MPGCTTRCSGKKAEGKAEGKAEDVLELLEELESVPKELRDEILSQKDMDILKVWFKAAAKAASLEEWERACNLRISKSKGNF